MGPQGVIFIAEPIKCLLLCFQIGCNGTESLLFPLPPRERVGHRLHLVTIFPLPLRERVGERGYMIMPFLSSDTSQLVAG